MLAGGGENCKVAFWSLLLVGYVRVRTMGHRIPA